jgi:thiol-disulfide isomerase/thioredoxin
MLLPLLLACRPPAPPATRHLPDPSGIEPLALPAGPGAATPRLSADDDALLMSWQEAGTVRTARLEEAWSVPVVVTDAAGLMTNWADFPSVAVGDGELLAHWLENQGESHHAYGVQLARSTDGGRSWTPLGSPHDASATEHGFVSILPVGDHFQLFWLDGRETEAGGAMTLRTAAVTDGVIGPSEILDERVCDCCGTAAALIDGQPAVLYRDRSEAEQRDIGLVTLRDGAWQPPVQIADDGWLIPGCPVNGPSLAASEAEPVAAWFTAARKTPQVRLSFARDRPRIVASGEGVLGRVALLMEDEDTALVSWLEAANAEQASIQLRRVHRDGRMGEPLSIGHTAASRGSGFPQLAWHGGRIVAAWTVPGEPSRVEAVRIMPGAVPPLEAVDGGQVALSPTALRLPTLPPRLDGAPVVLDPDRPVLLNLWATWCGPCREELSDLAALQERHPDLQVIAVSIDDLEHSAQVRAMVAERATGLTVLHGGDAPAVELGVTVLPTTVLFGAAGEAMWSVEGRFDPADLEAILEVAPETAP